MEPDFEAIAKRVVEDNRQSRERASARVSRLVEVLHSGSRELFTETINDIFDEAIGLKQKDGSILGEDGTPESPDGGDNSEAAQEGVGPTPQE